MDITTELIARQTTEALEAFRQQMPLSAHALFVVGASTSEVMGTQIGTNGSRAAAAALYKALRSFKEKTGIEFAFQCCEHLNRALVIERKTAVEAGYDEVMAVPIRTAGGAMATYAYSQMNAPILVESIRADAGMDIGDTFIGMHLKRVAVPVRTVVKSIGAAHVTMAGTRPALIGGGRACYERTEGHE